MQRSMDPSNPSDSSLPALPSSEDSLADRPLRQAQGRTRTARMTMTRLGIGLLLGSVVSVAFRTSEASTGLPVQDLLVDYRVKYQFPPVHPVPRKVEPREGPGGGVENGLSGEGELASILAELCTGAQPDGPMTKGGDPGQQPAPAGPSTPAPDPPTTGRGGFYLGRGQKPDTSGTVEASVGPDPWIEVYPPQ